MVVLANGLPDESPIAISHLLGFKVVDEGLTEVLGDVLGVPGELAVTAIFFVDDEPLFWIFENIYFFILMAFLFLILITAVSGSFLLVLLGLGSILVVLVIEAQCIDILDGKDFVLIGDFSDLPDFVGLHLAEVIFNFEL